MNGKLFDWLNDKRIWFKHAYQRVRYGVDDTMTFSLDYTLSELIAKLLKQYYEHADRYIVMDKDFRKYVKDCIRAFEEYADLDDLPKTNKQKALFKEDATKYFKEEQRLYRDTLRRMRKLFTKEYTRLWW